MKATDKDRERVLMLSERLSDVCRGFESGVVLRAGVNLCATAIVSAADTLDEAEDVADEVCEKLDKAVNAYWTAKHPH